ncbi:MAG: ornithine carbamoyltransferase [Myxococcota bacterium]|nr:ornithine carbamoyltransferase [Myxococcota bacterium]
MAKKDLITLDQLTRPVLIGLIERAIEMKNGHRERTLDGKTLAMIFAKASTRTRVSFEVGMFQLGGHALMMSTQSSQIGRGEPISDTAHVLSRYVDGIMIRTFHHDDVVELARNATVPVINALTDLTHPCQVAADLMTAAEEFGLDQLSNIKVAWIGDGNNMANSWINAAQVLGFELSLACPSGYGPDQAIVERAQAHGTRLHLTQSPHDAVINADVVTTDVWASMGQEDEAVQRQKAFDGFCVDGPLMANAKDQAIFLHCLPAHRGEEVTSQVIDGPRSRIYDEAENRLHIQKSILEWTYGVHQI